MAFKKNLMTENDDRKLKDIHNTTEENVEEEFNSQRNVINTLSGMLQLGPSKFKIVAQGYGNGNVINGLELAKERSIHVLLTGRWNSVWLISHDPGNDTITHSQIFNQSSNYTVTVSGMQLTLNCNSHAQYVLYRVK